MWRSLIGLVFGVGVLFSTSAVHAQCSKDTDCKGDRVCDAGSCVASPTPLPPAPAAPSGAASASGAPAAVGEPGEAQAVQAPRAEIAELPREEPARKPPRYSTGMMVSGIVMVSLAPIALILAASANNDQTACERGGASFDFGDGTVETYDGADCSTYDRTIYGGLIAGVVLAGVGIPMIVIGAKREPVATATISPWATPSAAGLGLRLDM